MSHFFTTVTLGIFSLCFSAAFAQAQSRLSGGDAYAAIGPDAANRISSAGTPSAEKALLVGKITNAAGVLAGAVVILTGSKKMAVTNANGEFEMEVPANSGPLQAPFTYAGYADENILLNPGGATSTVTMANATVIVIARRQRMKAYLKTARKQVKHDLHKIHSK